jgi:hypothetical protein
VADFVAINGGKLISKLLEFKNKLELTYANFILFRTRRYVSPVFNSHHPQPMIMSSFNLETRIWRHSCGTSPATPAPPAIWLAG